MEKRAAYHHGDLRASLIEAGESVLQETGVERFSLRQVARKVGVSHSAPAHHFGDAGGLLDAISASGFSRLLAMMEANYAQSGPDPHDGLTGSGVGYVIFAKSAPATFGLMFGPTIKGSRSDALVKAQQAAFEHLAINVERLTKRDRVSEPAVMQDILACWSMVHGLSDLFISGGLKDIDSLPEKEQVALFRGIIRRAMPKNQTVK